MTKQQKTYVLLIAVAIVWGLIGYRFYKNSNPTIETAPITQQQQTYIPTEFKKGESYTVKADYRDPFLGKFYSEKKKKKKTNTTLKKETTIPFPTIIYNGIVEGGTSKSYTLTINGKQQLFKLGESINDIKLLKANSEQIIVRFNGVSKTIKLR